MSSSTKEVLRFTAAVDSFSKAFPHLAAWLSDEEAVRRLLVKAQEDGTFLAVAAGDDAAGGPVVCFGVGYGPLGALFGIDRTLQGGRWKADRFELDKRK